MAADKQGVKNQKDFNNEMSNSISLEQQIIDLLKTRRGIDSGILSDQQDISNVLQDQVSQQKFLNSEKKLTRDISNQITKAATEAYSIQQDELGLTSTNAKLKKQQESLEKNIILAKQQQAKFAKMATEGDAKSRELNAAIAESLGEQVTQAQIIQAEMKKISRESKLTSDSLGVKTFGGLSDLVKSVPGLSRFSGPFQEAAEAARKHGAAQAKMLTTGKGLTKDKIKELGLTKKLTVTNADGTKKVLTGRAAAVKLQKEGVKLTGTMGAGFKSLGPAIAKAFGPMALAVAALNQIIKAFGAADKAAGDLAKSQGISYNEAAAFNKEIADSGVTTGKLLTTTKDVVAAQIELNKVFGTSVKFSNEFAAEFSEIQKTTGLSTESMKMFAEQAMVGGTSIQDQLVQVTAVTQELNNQNGVAFSAKSIQEGLAKASASQLITAGRNTKELANQVFQAKLVGLNMQQLESVGRSMLDFESSIAAEMEAELMTGKQLNLEKAREAALQGDLATLASEMRKEVGTAAEFGEMNVLQQEALAKAFGMQREDMAAMLLENEKLEKVKAQGFESMDDAQKQYNEAVKSGNMSEELKKKLADAGVLKQMESVTQQEKMAAITEKLTDLFIKLADPLIPVISKIMEIGSAVITTVTPAFQMLGKIIEGLMVVIQPIVDAFLTIFDLVQSIFDPTKSFGDVLAEAGPIVSGLAVAFGVVGTALVVSIVPSMYAAAASAVGYAISMASAAIAAVTTASAATLGIGIAAVVAGIAAAAYAFNNAKKEASSAGDMISPADGKTMVSTKEGGLFSLSPNDDLVAGPGAAQAISNSGGGGNNDAQLMALNTKMSRLIALIEQGGNVYIDSTKVGTAMAVGSYKVQ